MSGLSLSRVISLSKQSRTFQTRFSNLQVLLWLRYNIRSFSNAYQKSFTEIRQKVHAKYYPHLLYSHRRSSAAFDIKSQEVCEGRNCSSEKGTNFMKARSFRT